jgi:hypothetical protein
MSRKTDASHVDHVSLLSVKIPAARINSSGIRKFRCVVFGMAALLGSRHQKLDCDTASDLDTLRIDPTILLADE